MSKLFQLDLAALSALVFDVDGTLYRQRPLRNAMLLRLLRYHAFRPAAGLVALRIITAYRRAQEELRNAAETADDLAAAQLGFASELSGVNKETVEICVSQWIEREPLQIINRYKEEGLTELLIECRSRGVKLGIFSDYPAMDKLAALGVLDYFDVTLCAQDPGIGAFKPDPKGIQRVIEQLCLSPRQTLYVGDRPDIDGAAAEAAGVPCAIITRRPRNSRGAGTKFVQFESYNQLRELLFR